MLIEARDKRELASIFKRLGTSLAKRINAAAPSRSLQEKVSVSRGRYHLHVLKTPREVKRALKCVL